MIAPPASIDSGNTAQPAADGQLFVYPSCAQEASDRYQCDISAVERSGYDPTQEDGGVSPAAEVAKQVEYCSAEAACLEGRGYRAR